MPLMQNASKGMVTSNHQVVLQDANHELRRRGFNLNHNIVKHH